MTSDSTPATRTKVELAEIFPGVSHLHKRADGFVRFLDPNERAEAAHRCNVHDDLYDLACNIAGTDPGSIDRNADVNSLRAMLHEFRSAAIEAKAKAEGRAEASEAEAQS